MTTKMGMHNLITKERYDKAKVELKSPKDDERVMKKYGFGETTARRIRRTDGFYDYSSKTTTGRNRREHLEHVLNEDQEKDFVVFPSRYVDAEQYLKFEDIPSATIKPLVLTIITLACVLIALGGIIIAVLVGGAK